MFNKKIVLPQEGDLLFQQKTFFQSATLPAVTSVLASIFYLFVMFKYGLTVFKLWDHILFIFGLLIFIVVIIFLIDGFRNGFKDETYKGYFFHDKIVFYRISKTIDEFYTENKSKEQLLKEIIEVKDKVGKNEFSFQLYMLEKGLEVSENPRKPHKFELKLSDVKYFINEKDYIKIVKEDQENENEDSFYNKVELSDKYKKCKSEVVEFLNKQMKEAKLLKEH